MSLSATCRAGSVWAGISLTIGKFFFLAAIPDGPLTLAPMWTMLCILSRRSILLARTSGNSSDMRWESVYRLAWSISNLVMAMPELGPR